MTVKRTLNPVLAGVQLRWLIFLIGTTLCHGAIGQLSDTGINKNPGGTGSIAPNQEEILPSVALADLRGHWIRVGDDFQGLVMKIDGPENQLEGRIVYLSPNAREFGFRIDDVKVKDFARTGGDQLSVNSLQRAGAQLGFQPSYVENVVYTRGTNELLMRQAKGEEVLVGAWQRWVRTDASKQKYWVEITETLSERPSGTGMAIGVGGGESLETSLEEVRAEIGRLEKEGKTNENYALKDFVGTWSRADDDFEGLTMEIKTESSTALNGRLVVIPATAKSEGFGTGDIKIRVLQEF